MNVEELTTKFLSNIEPKLTSVSYNAYFKNMQIMDIDMNYETQKKIIIDSDNNNYANDKIITENRCCR